ncbi:hypothetical protein ACF0H5_012550 [Mactra antiquata]
MTSHSAGRMILIFIGFICYAVTLFISYTSSSKDADVLGIFNNGTGTVSDKFYIPITPAGWTFGLIWGIIYVLQAIWYIYALTTICRKDNEGRYLYTLPFLPPVFYVVFLLNNIFVVAWLIVWDREYINWALGVIIFTPFTLYICLVFSYRGLYNSIETLQRGGAGKEVWFNRILVQNGMSFFATWVSIASLLNFAIVLSYTWSRSTELSSTVALGLLSVEIIVWFTLDVFFLDKYTRYTVTPYIVVVVALIGSINKNFDLDIRERNSIFTAVLLGVAGLLLLMKLIVIVVRHRKYPIKGNASDDVKGIMA